VADRTLKITILGDSKSAERAFNSLDKASSGVHDTVKKIGLALAGAFTVTAGVSLFKGFLAEGEEARKSAAQTAAVIKSTGGAAHVSAKDIDALSTALSNKIGVDDEAIASGANLLLTFTEVQNRVGKGNDIFNQATDVMTDMSAALGQDMPASAMQLGKALNDPIRGVTALRRVGVTFTKQQEDQIKAMVKAGDVAGAQKIILGELRKEFGGSAAAQATAGQKLSVIWGNVQEQIGTALLPIFDKVATWLGAVLPKAVDGATAAVSRITALVKSFVYTLTTGFTEDEGTPIEAFALKVRQLIPVIEAVVDWIQNHLVITLVALGAVIVLLVGGPIALVIAALVAAYIKFGWFRTGVQAVVDFFANVVIPAVVAVADAIVGQTSHAVEWVQRMWPQISEAVGHVMNAVRDVVNVVLAVVMAVWHAVGDDIMNYVGRVFHVIGAVIDAVMGVIRGIIITVLALINGDWGKAWDGIKQIVASVWDGIYAIVSGLIGQLKSIIAAGLSIVTALFSAGWDAVKDVVLGGVRFVVDNFLGLVQTIIDGAAKAFGWVPGIGGKLKDAAADFDRFRDDVNAALGGIKDKVVHVEVRGVDRTIDTSHPGSFAAGGVTPGGPVIVGEKGIELVDLPRGSVVHNHADTMRMLGGAVATCT
jgi:hypothetical protein